MTSLLAWLKQKLSSSDAPDDPYSQRPPTRVMPVQKRRRPVGAARQPEKAPKPQSPDSLEGVDENQHHIADGGPGKNVLVRSRHIREDTGTHDTLKILDESVFESDKVEEFDPYNTGRFDRSKSWDGPSRKK